MDLKTEVVEAEARIRPYIRQTFLEHSPYLSRATGAKVYLKLENLQHTGSFKTRGAFNKLLSLSSEQRDRGCVAASTGNHGAAVAYALDRLGARGLIFVPENASSVKVAAIEALGGEVHYHGTDGAITEQYARRYAAERSMIYVSPYNDLRVIGGQGTIAVELCRQLDSFDEIFVSLGGGGLIGGIAGYLKSEMPQTRITGCSPRNSQVMIDSVGAGRILDLESLPTLSDGTAGGIEPGAITFEICRSVVDGYVSVEEEEIAGAMRLIMDHHHILIEGSAGVAVASLLKQAQELQGKTVVVLLCGANVSRETLKKIL